MRISLIGLAAGSAMRIGRPTFDIFCVIGSTPTDEKYADWATEAGFAIDLNTIGREVRTITGAFEGTKAVIAVPRGSTTFEEFTLRYGQYFEVELAIASLNVGTNWEALESEGAIVICEPVPQCSQLAERLTEAVLNNGV